MISIPSQVSGDPAMPMGFRIVPISAESEMDAERAAGVQAELLSAFERACRSLLHDPALVDERRDAAWRALESRGVSPGALPHLPVGLFLDWERLKPDLLATGASMATINLSRLLADPRLPGRLVGPIRTVDGRTISFWARHPCDDSPRFLFLHRTWRQAVPAIGLDVALECGGREDLVLLEDPLDWLMLQSHGLLRVAALAGPFRELSVARWRLLADAGVRRVTLAVQDFDDRHAVASAIHNARRVYPAMEVFVYSLRRARAWLALEGAGSFDDRMLRARILGRRYLLQGIKLPVRVVSSSPLPTVPVPVPVAAPRPIALKTPEPLPAILPASNRWQCDLHRCAETDCFCFD